MRGNAQQSALAGYLPLSAYRLSQGGFPDPGGACVPPAGPDARHPATRRARAQGDGLSAGQDALIHEFPG